jgi:flagellar motor switch protein FliN/FliY
MSDTDIETNEDVGDEWADAMAEQEETEAASGSAAGEPEAAAEAAPFKELQADASDQTDSEVSLDAILDVPITISMEIGRTKINIRNLLQLNQGSVVELDRLAGEPMDVLVNGTLIAQGEVVVVNEKFGIRLTDIISPTDRVKRLA